jgi:hypothetical protein
MSHQRQRSQRHYARRAVALLLHSVLSNAGNAPLFVPRIQTKPFPTEFLQAQRLARALVNLQQHSCAQCSRDFFAAVELADSHHVPKQNVQDNGTPRQWQDDAAAVLCETRCFVACAGAFALIATIIIDNSNMTMSARPAVVFSRFHPRL